MDMKKTVREIGLFETAISLAKFTHSNDVLQKVGASMPLPDTNILSRIEKISEWLLSFGKRKYMFLTPEIALIEEMFNRSDRDIEFIFALPSDLELEAKERIFNNLPNGVKTHVIVEPDFPRKLFPGNGILVVSGYLAGDRAMVLPDTYRMVEHYNSNFLGKKVFVPYTEQDNVVYYDGWIEMNHQRVSEKWGVA